MQNIGTHVLFSETGSSSSREASRSTPKSIRCTSLTESPVNRFKSFFTTEGNDGKNTKLKSLVIGDSSGSSTLSPSSSTPKATRDQESTLNISSSRTKMKHRGRFTEKEVTILLAFKSHTPNPSQVQIDRLSSELNIIPFRIESFFTTDKYNVGSNTTKKDKNKKFQGALSNKELEVLKRFVLNVTVFFMSMF